MAICENSQLQFNSSPSPSRSLCISLSTLPSIFSVCNSEFTLSSSQFSGELSFKTLTNSSFFFARFLFCSAHGFMNLISHTPADDWIVHLVCSNCHTQID
ncbi:hypothetical protein Dimus_017499 [Dionaea muscipula]